MKRLTLLYFFFLCLSYHDLLAQDSQVKDREAIISLIDDYSKARDLQDTTLLKNILMPNVDQLVSSGEWRTGIDAAVEGMQRSSKSNQGKRSLEVEKVRFLSEEVALADARYVIENIDGNKREMWSTFMLVFTDKGWKISGIRNMLPSGQN